MPRASRYIVPGQTYHITQRCHNREFLLKFAKDRNRYREMLRERLETHAIDLFNYCITSNHVHLLLRDRASDDASRIPAFMNSLAGDFAQYYNLRKQRSGSFWGDRYHATMVDSGAYLFRCLKYIDLNMFRAGVVSHPMDWAWTGYQELVGVRHRYCLIHRERLLELLRQTDTGAFVTNYQVVIQEAIAANDLTRDAIWTETIAVGSKAFVQQLAPHIRNREEVVPTAIDRESNTMRAQSKLWVIREPEPAYR